MRYNIFVIDPPWNKKKGGLRNARPNQGRSLDYKTMTTGDIFELLDREIFLMADEIHAVFLWTVDQFLHESEQYMEQRGYKRHCRFIWDKTNGVAPAFTVRYTHEYLIWFYKPKMMPVAPQMRGVLPTVFTEKGRQHSRKPDIAYKIIDQLYPVSSKLDVFSREPRDGWDQWGDQINFYNNHVKGDQP